jgi:hypothetical protein
LDGGEFALISFSFVEEMMNDELRLRERWDFPWFGSGH